MLSEEINFGNVPLVSKPSDPEQQRLAEQATFPNGKTTLKFDEFINIVKDSCMDRD